MPNPSYDRQPYVDMTGVDAFARMGSISRSPTAHDIRQQTRHLAEMQETLLEQASEQEARDAAQVAREERALALAEASHAEAVAARREAEASRLETVRARKIAAWSLAVAVLAIVVAVVVPLIVG